MTFSFKQLVDLTVEQRAVLEAFECDTELSHTFYLIGGTLLKALGIVPRISNDLVFFTVPEINQLRYPSYRKRFGSLLAEIFGGYEIDATQEGFIHRPSGMVIDIVAEDIKNIEDFVLFGNLKTASVRDCAANKASALCSRDELKDYIDIAFLTKAHSWLLNDLEALAEKKFGPGTITEEKLLTELIAKQKQFDIPTSIFLMEGEKNRQLVKDHVALLIEKSSL